MSKLPFPKRRGFSFREAWKHLKPEVPLPKGRAQDAPEIGANGLARPAVVPEAPPRLSQPEKTMDDQASEHALIDAMEGTERMRPADPLDLPPDCCGRCVECGATAGKVELTANGGRCDLCAGTLGPPLPGVMEELARKRRLGLT